MEKFHWASNFLAGRFWSRSVSLAFGIARTALVVADNERWLHEAKASADLSAALDWALNRPATGDNADEVVKRLKD